MYIFLDSKLEDKILDRMIAGIAGEKSVCAGGYWGRGVKEQELCILILLCLESIERQPG
jgi:hypothetical protein